MAIDKFVETLMQTIDADLKAQDVPVFNWKFNDSLDAKGSFDSKQWIVFVNPRQFSATNPDAKKLSDLTGTELADVVGTLYHESRHTDQDVLIVRTLLEQKKDPAQINTETEINLDAVKAIKAATFANPIDATERTHAQAMIEVMYGKHNELLKFVMDQGDVHSGVTDLKFVKTVDDLIDGEEHVKALGEWQSNTLAPEIADLQATAKPSDSEKRLLADLTQVTKTITALRTAFDKANAKTKPSAADFRAVKAAAKSYETKLLAAYHNLEGEKDAFRVEGEVQKAFKKGAGIK
jgi:hypothetical protein